MSSKRIEKKNPRRLAVVHWLPIEQFPPVQNFLNFFAEQEGLRVLCCSTRRIGEQHEFHNPKVSILRTKFPSQELGKFIRIVCFLYFPLITLLKLLFFQPNVIFYLEPHSAPVVFIYSLIFPRCQIIAHYHEYREPKHLKVRGNYLAWLGNQLEKLRLFNKASWISHTNQDRIRLFLLDYPNINAHKVHAIPNIPPRTWLTEKEKVLKPADSKLKLVYIGAISLHDTYLEQLLSWFQKNQDHNVSLDLYINNTDPATKKFLAEQDQDGLTIHLGGVPYAKLPSILPKYDIGLVLYRCNTINYIYNAPNKLFEYLSCGLNVLYPKQMLGVLPYARTGCVPWVIGIDFEFLSDLTVPELENFNGASKPWEETCEVAYQPLLEKILRSTAHS